MYKGSTETFRNEIRETGLEDVLKQQRIWSALEGPAEESIAEDPRWIDYSEGKIHVFGEELEPLLEDEYIGISLPYLNFSDYSEGFADSIIELLEEADSTEDLESIGEVLAVNAAKAVEQEIHESGTGGILLLSSLETEYLEKYNFGPVHESEATDLPPEYAPEDIFYIRVEDGETEGVLVVTSDPLSGVYYFGNMLQHEIDRAELSQEELDALSRGIGKGADSYH